MLLNIMRTILDGKSKAYTFFPFDEKEEKNRQYHLKKRDFISMFRFASSCVISVPIIRFAMTRCSLKDMFRP